MILNKSPPFTKSLNFLKRKLLVIKNKICYNIYSEWEKRK